VRNGYSIPRAWTPMDRERFSGLAAERLSDAECAARGIASELGADLKFLDFARELWPFSRGTELPFPVPRGPIYGSEVIAVVDGREVPLGALIAVGMYDEQSGEGVIFDDEWIEAQLDGLRDLLKAAVELSRGGEGRTDFTPP